MTAQEYIISTLEKLAEPVEMENIGKTPLEDAIYSKVMSKKFRKVRADEDSINITKKAISLAVKNNSPIKINLIFGGNKLWRLDEAPEIDWAELFATIYYCRWMKYIANVYEPGVYFEYYSEDVVLENMNNLPKVETDQYSATFITMLEWIKQYLPEEVSFAYKRYGDEYDREEAYLSELEEAKKKVLIELGGNLPKLSEQQKLATEMNVRLSPDQANDPLWREKAELTHLSIERTKTMEDYIADASFIAAGTTHYPGCIAVGSTKKSYAKFWVGVGALDRPDDPYNELVLTPKQLESAKFEWEDTTIPGLVGKNFQKIRVLKKV